MKLLTTGGLLYATVQAQNADGTSGTYQSFDWVAMFPEGANGGLNIASNASPINIGWNPAVVEVISNWDGGKTIAGFGKVTGTIYASWVIKMWGNVGTTNCGDNATISGYVTMAMGLLSDLAALPANCVLTSNAKVQWAWTNLPATKVTTTTDRVSYVITSATEDYAVGSIVTSSSAGEDSFIIVAGGTTRQSWQAYGMNSWTMTGQYIDMNGVTATKSPVDMGGLLDTTKSDTDAFTIPAISTVAEQVFNTGVIATLLLTAGQFMANHCWTAIQGVPSLATYSDNSAQSRAAIGGYSGSITTCLKHAVDGYSFWGANILARVGGDDWVGTKFPSADGTPANNWAAGALTGVAVASGPMDNALVNGTAVKGVNLAQVRVIKVNYSATTYEAFYLLTTSEWYWNSVFFSAKLSPTVALTVTPQATGQLARATYGSVWNFWLFDSNNSTLATLYAAQVPDKIACVGTKAGKGALHRATLAGAVLIYTAAETAIFTNDDAAGVVTINSPTGGMGQFKGAQYGTTEQKYVQVICVGVAPMYYTTWAIDMDTGASNGWIVSCYTGIPSCEASLADGVTALSATEVASCMNDPRYMNWRVMTMKVERVGTVGWYRTDSYWNSSDSMFSSTWGVGVSLSVSLTSDDDGQGTTNKGKTFVFAYSDGSGVQLNHIAFGTSPVSSNSSAGSGTNTLTTAPTTFTNTTPNMVNQQYCGTSNLDLSGTSDTSALSSTITDWSDGYKAKVTMNLEMILPGAAGGWRGVCMVYYSSQYVMDNTNGSICFAAQTDSGTGKGPIDFGAGYLMSVASSVWQPPANKASLQPSSSALTGGKYDIVYAPSAATAFMYTENYYASVTWYQPKYASSYSGIARYGKDDYVGAFCMQGSGSNSYFGAVAASVKLTGAMYLAVGVISLGTALSLAI